MNDKKLTKLEYQSGLKLPRQAPPPPIMETEIELYIAENGGQCLVIKVNGEDYSVVGNPEVRQPDNFIHAHKR